MLKFLLILVLAVVGFLAVYVLRVMFLVWRFLGEMGLVNTLRQWFFDTDDLYEKYKDKPMHLLVDKKIIEFDNFAGGIDFLEQYAKMLLEDYQKIINLTEYYELNEFEQILNDTITQVRMWKWKHNNENKN